MASPLLYATTAKLAGTHLWPFPEREYRGFVRELLPEERALWGTCPVCHVLHRQPCETGIDGAHHQAREERAPKCIFEAPCGW